MLQTCEFTLHVWGVHSTDGKPEEYEMPEPKNRITSFMLNSVSNNIHNHHPQAMMIILLRLQLRLKLI